MSCATTKFIGCPRRSAPPGRRWPARGRPMPRAPSLIKKTEAGIRQIPLSDGTLEVIADWKRYVKDVKCEALVFATRFGRPISPNNVLRRWIVPACVSLGLPKASWLTFRRTYATWRPHEKRRAARVVAQIMGHAKVDTTLNVTHRCPTTRPAAATVGSELFRVVQFARQGGDDANSLKILARRTGRFPQLAHHDGTRSNPGGLPPIARSGSKPGARRSTSPNHQIALPRVFSDMV